MHAEHVAEVLVVRADLDHGEGGLVVALADQAHDEPDVDHRQHGVHADHRPHADQRVEDDQDQAGDQVERAEPQHPCLQQGEDQ
ncbi:hypothetical protein [Nocardioides ungokensis]|uniref:hypothetical protein n=1 Tax=Nocardioides ungokensis TaxID=1643322 RepID=UPI001FE90DEF|nr:hypothetical protein [Nocardioides ungokensis]